MSSGTDTNSSGANANSSGANADRSATNANSSSANTDGSIVNTDSSSYQAASVVSGLGASVAAQLYSFFNDPQNYTHPVADGEEPLASCGHWGGKCPRYYNVAISCYTAVALNIAAAVTAFVVINWQAKYAARSNAVSKRMLDVGHLVWFFTFYSGLIMIMSPVIQYAFSEAKPQSKGMLLLFLSFPILLFAVYIWTEMVHSINESYGEDVSFLRLRDIIAMRVRRRRTPASGSSEDTSPKEGASAPV